MPWRVAPPSPPIPTPRQSFEPVPAPPPAIARLFAEGAGTDSEDELPAAVPQDVGRHADLELGDYTTAHSSRNQKNSRNRNLPTMESAVQLPAHRLLYVRELGHHPIEGRQVQFFLGWANGYTAQAHLHLSWPVFL